MFVPPRLFSEGSAAGRKLATASEQTVSQKHPNAQALSFKRCASRWGVLPRLEPIGHIRCQLDRGCPMPARSYAVRCV